MPVYETRGVGMLIQIQIFTPQQEYEHPMQENPVIGVTEYTVLFAGGEGMFVYETQGID